MPDPTRKPLTINGITYASQSEAARALNIPLTTIRQRLKDCRLPTENIKNVPLGGCDSIKEYADISGIPPTKIYRYIHKYKGDHVRALQVLINKDVKRILLAEKNRVARINGDGIDSIMYFRDKDNRVIAQYTYSQFRYKDKIYAIKMSELKILMVKCGYPEFTKNWLPLEKIEAAKKAVKSREKTANKLKRD